MNADRPITKGFFANAQSAEPTPLIIGITAFADTPTPLIPSPIRWNAAMMPFS